MKADFFVRKPLTIDELENIVSKIKRQDSEHAVMLFGFGEKDTEELREKVEDNHAKFIQVDVVENISKWFDTEELSIKLVVVKYKSRLGYSDGVLDYIRNTIKNYKIQAKIAIIKDGVDHLIYM